MLSVQRARTHTALTIIRMLSYFGIDIDLLGDKQLSKGMRRVERLMSSLKGPEEPYLTIKSPVATRASARVVGTPRWNIASLMRYSRIEDRSTCVDHRA